MPSKAKERVNFGKIKEIIAPPNLIEVQVNSYHEFLQAEVSPEKRRTLAWKPCSTKSSRSRVTTKKWFSV